LLADVQQLARRQPAVFIGSAFELGLVGARFLKSSQPPGGVRPGIESRRSQYGGRSAPRTAHDRGAAPYGGEIDVTINRDAVAIPDMDDVDAAAADEGRSTGTIEGVRGSGRSRRPTTRRGKS